jgi:hypothetical protein
MRAVLVSIVIAAAIGFAGSAGAVTPPTKATIFAKPAPTNATVIAKRCRCEERSWNGSCTRRVCR